MELGGIGAGELAGRDLVGEEYVQLAIGAALWFRQAEVDPDAAEGVDAEPEEAGLGAPIPSGGVEHVGRPDAVEDAEDVVHVAREHDSLGAQAGGGELGDEGVAHGANGKIV